MGDIVEIFEADDGERGWGVKPCLRVWSARALDSGVARASGTGGIGAVRIELFLGDGILRYWAPSYLRNTMRVGRSQAWV